MPGVSAQTHTGFLPSIGRLYLKQGLHRQTRKKEFFMKRTFIVVAVIAALVAPLWAQTSGKTPDGLEWSTTSDKKGIVITKYSGTAKDVRIPDKINNLPVVEIGDNAFQAGAATEITSVVIPNTVTKIGTYAFMAQEKLTTAKLPSSLIEIGNSAFAGCYLLTQPLALPLNLTTIAARAFMDCESLTGLQLPVPLMTIGNEAFRNCTALRDVSFLGSIKRTWGNNVFLGCTSLESPSQTRLKNNGYTGSF
jgi:hypothetical protein